MYAKLIGMDHIKFLREAGRKGGKARKANARRVELARAAAVKRWTRNRAGGTKTDIARVQDDAKQVSNDGTG